MVAKERERVALKLCPRPPDRNLSSAWGKLALAASRHAAAQVTLSYSSYALSLLEECSEVTIFIFTEVREDVSPAHSQEAQGMLEKWMEKSPDLARTQEKRLVIPSL